MSDLVDRAEAAMRRLDASTALSLYQGPASGVPEDRLRAGQIRALWLLRRWDEARALLTDADPTSVHTAIARGVIALGQPDDPREITLHNRSANGDTAGAVAAFREAVRLDPLSDVAAAGLATALRVAGKIDEAEAVLADWLTMPEPSNETLLARAMIAVDRDHVGEARKYLDRIITVDPEDHRVVYHHADLDPTGWDPRLDDLVAEGAPAAVFRRVAQGWRDFGLARRGGSGRDRLLDAANTAFASSIEAGPALPAAFVGRARIAELRSGMAAARPVLAPGLSLEADSPALIFEQVLLTDDTDERRVLCRRILDRDPRDLGPRIELAVALLLLDRGTEARDLLADMTVELPDRHDLCQANAWIDMIDGRLERGLAGFRRLRREDTEAVVNEMRCLRMLGMVEQAEALYEQTIARPPAGSLVGLKREYAYCAMHEGRYEQTKARARVVLADVPKDRTGKTLLLEARLRATMRWWRIPWDENRAVELARMDLDRGRRRAEVIPEHVRERTLGRLRALEWELAKERASEEKWSAHTNVWRTSRFLVAFVLYVGLRVAGRALDYPDGLGLPGALVVVVGWTVVMWWWLGVGFSRGRSVLAVVSLLAGAFGYLWLRNWQLAGLWDTALLVGFVMPVISASLVNFVSTFLPAAKRKVRAPVHLGRWRRRQAALRRRYPFASMLLDLEELDTLLGDEHAMASAGARERCARLFECVAMAADRLIRRARTESFEDEPHPVAWLYQPKPSWLKAWVRPLAGMPDALLEQRLNRCAASVVTQLRQYKRQVLLPGVETFTELRQKVVRFTELACERRWDALPQPEPENVARRFRARVMVSMRLAVVAAVGPAVLVAYEVLPGTRPPVPALVAIALYVGWPLLTVLIRVDPDLRAKLDVLAQWLPSPKAGTGGQDLPTGRDGGKK